MQAIDHWRKWRPSDKYLEKSASTGTSKPPEVSSEGFAGAVPAQIPKYFSGRSGSGGFAGAVPKTLQDVSDPERDSEAGAEPLKPIPDKYWGKSEGTVPPEPAKPTSEGFAGTVTAQIPNNFCLPEHDPTAWRQDFQLWRAERCIHREDRDDSGSVKFLHADFCEWAIAHDSVPCRHATFERLVTDAGFELEGRMVLGLVLREELESLRGLGKALQ